MMTDAKVLIKLKAMGMSSFDIAAKMGLTVEQVDTMWAELQVLAKEQNGHGDLVAQYNHMCHQYQLLGESLKIVAMCVHAAMPPSEIRALIVPNDVNATVKNLCEQCIILRPFVPQNPEDSLREHLKRTAEGN